MLNRKSIHVFMNSSEKFARCLQNEYFYAAQQFRLICQLFSSSLNDFQYQPDTKALEIDAK